jgi:hypothetical protein
MIGVGEAAVEPPPCLDLSREPAAQKSASVENGRGSDVADDRGDASTSAQLRPPIYFTLNEHHNSGVGLDTCILIWEWGLTRAF